jgi:hypothetical protein
VATFNAHVDVNGQHTISRPWTDWRFSARTTTQVVGGFHVHNPWGTSNQPLCAASRNRLKIRYRAAGGQDLSGLLVIAGPTGDAGIGHVDPAAKQHVSGDLIVTGDGKLQNADCAEGFQLAEGEAPPPGTVLVLDRDERVAESNLAYDRRVVGVIAGAGYFRPGIRLSLAGCGGNEVPIVLVARVNCLVKGAVAIGDLPTRSELPGHTMRAGELLRAFGAVLGKALQPVVAGAALVPVLIGLG